MEEPQQLFVFTDDIVILTHSVKDTKNQINKFIKECSESMIKLNSSKMVLNVDISSDDIQ